SLWRINLMAGAWDGSSIHSATIGRSGNGCPHEQASHLRDHHRLRVHGGGGDWLRLSLHRVQGATSVSIRYRMGRAPPSHSDCVWSVYAPGPQLGALACARLDFLPRDPQRLPHTVSVGNSRSVLRNLGLFSLPPHSNPLLSGRQNIV